eukprot:767511-Hanusia_phi.AAC.3
MVRDGGSGAGGSDETAGRRAAGRGTGCPYRGQQNSASTSRTRIRRTRLTCEQVHAQGAGACDMRGRPGGFCRPGMEGLRREEKRRSSANKLNHERVLNETNSRRFSP